MSWHLPKLGLGDSHRTPSVCLVSRQKRDAEKKAKLKNHYVERRERPLKKKAKVKSLS
jgi:hypothetical protein